MNTYQAEASAVIDAPAARVYEIIADYRLTHPTILPQRYFTGIEVTEGGRGAGTKLTTTMNVYGTKAVYHLTVTEPEPGRVLLEEDPAAGIATTFTVEPLDDGAGSRVTIATTARSSGGLRGRLERVMNPAIMERIYREELELLAAAAKE